MLIKKLTDEERERAWQRYESCNREIQMDQILDVSHSPYLFSIWTERKDFGSEQEYRENLAREHGFESSKKYQEYIIRRRGFSSGNEYRRQLAKKRSERNI